MKDQRERERERERNAAKDSPEQNIRLKQKKAFTKSDIKRILYSERSGSHGIFTGK